LSVGQWPVSDILPYLFLALTWAKTVKGHDEGLLQQTVPHVFKLLDNLGGCTIELAGNHTLLV